MESGGRFLLLFIKKFFNLNLIGADAAVHCVTAQHKNGSLP
jgi:hypothetical protein